MLKLNFKSQVIASILLAIVFFTIIVFRPQKQAIYPLIRDIGTRGMDKVETANFIINYEHGDARSAAIVAAAAEEAYNNVIAALGYKPAKKTLVIIYANKKEMVKAFGQLGSEGAMGVYWGGVIQVLSPYAWLKPGQTATDYKTTGPMVHEFTHLVFDYMTNGNYPRWFTEGLAQYM